MKILLRRLLARQHKQFYPWFNYSQAILSGTIIVLISTTAVFGGWKGEADYSCPVAINGFNKYQRAITEPSVTQNLEHHRNLKKGNLGHWVFFGDSMVMRWHQDSVNDFLKPRGVSLLGVAGDRVEQILWRLRQGEIDGKNPNLILLWFGINNAGTNTDEEIATGIITVRDELKVKYPEAQLVVMALHPAGREPNTGYRQQIGCVNHKLSKKIAPEKLWDISEDITDSKGYFIKELTADYLHLNSKGYAKITAPLIKELEQLVSPKVKGK